jgi:Leucine-rich repeat (LRR) protein
MRTLLIITLLILFSCASKTKYNQTALDLGSNRLRQLPDSVLKMHSLEYLNLGNAFTLYPPLSALGSDMRIAGKNDNQLTKLPKDFIQLKRLRTLYIHANKLVELPVGFHRLAQLDTLDLSFNEHLKLSKLMGELEKMCGLKYLNIIEISANPELIKRLKKSLPNTKVITKLDELEFETENFE